MGSDHAFLDDQKADASHQNYLVSDFRALMIDALRDFRRSWKKLALTSLVFKIIAVVLLTPLAGLLFRFLIMMSGTPVLTDVDLVYLSSVLSGWDASSSLAHFGWESSHSNRQRCWGSCGRSRWN